jgi:putative DNA primase/helicase
VAWQREGLAPPASVRGATADYLAAEDAFERWFDDCCTVDRNAWESSAALWASWKDWAERAGEFVGKQRKFSDKLEEHDLTAARDGTRANNRGYRGVRLNHPDYTEDTRYGN